MIMRFANLGKIVTVMGLLAGSTAAQSVNPATVLNSVHQSVAGAQGQAPAPAVPASPKAAPSISKTAPSTPKTTPPVAKAPSATVKTPSAKAPAASAPAPPKGKQPAPAAVAADKSAPADTSAPADKTLTADKGVRRDPFDSLVNTKVASTGDQPENLPPGKPGLVINSLRIDGIVKGTSGMIAIVSNAQQRVYFIHEGDKLYDGSVEHITLEGVSFHELGKDAFGRPTDHDVTKRLYPSPGEQQ